ncbi:hypothetical protein SAMN06265348_1245 [Pedobacter westerhofensis]|uniref:Uncharacterized protein n=1 Tax=Pedobacter westerhofensis TaxID=425512 RepID=A0A521FTW0_9SPHI|nr:hypothetical protein SAMN06265348_1245 [Pedobacter westerhofensis]
MILIEINQLYCVEVYKFSVIYYSSEFCNPNDQLLNGAIDSDLENVNLKLL